jgi:rare lipoprotein A
MWRIAILLSLGVLAACASKGRERPPPEADERRYESLDGPPNVPFDVDAIPEPVPKDEPLARYGNHSPYSVFGKRYKVLPRRSGYVERGTASWYGTKFHGRLTSTREPYDMYAFTAAHKTLPLPSYARVTHLKNGRSVVVRINDRGPFVGDRLIDLSYAAAVKLGMHLTGTAPVEVRVLEPGASAAPPLPVVEEHRPTASVGTGWYVQLGAFSERQNAFAYRRRLGSEFGPVRVYSAPSGGKTVWRVRVGPFAARHDAEAVRERLVGAGYTQARVLRR